MPRKNRFLNSFLSILLILSITLTNVNVAFADDGPTPEPTVAAEPTEEPVQPTAEPTEPPVVEPSEPPVVATEPPVVETPVPTEAAPTQPATVTDEQAPITALLTQAPENTDLVVLDENGQVLPLTSQEALDAILETDPMWCPAGILPGGAGCTTNFATISALMTDMINNTTTYDENGVIYFTTSPGASFSLTNTTLGASDYTTLSNFNLTLQGGWNGLNGASATFTSQTNFASNTLTIGSLANPWVGSLTLNNLSFSNVSTAAAVTVYTTSGNITLDNVDVTDQTGSFNTALINSTSGNITVQNGSVFDGNNGAPPINGQSSGFSATTGSGSITISNTIFQESQQNGSNTYDGATLSAPTVTLTNVTAQNNDGDGITINNANTVTLNNVTATANGTESGTPGLSGNDGSGIFINGNAGSSVYINGGTFTNNQEYGVEVAVPANTTIYIQSKPNCANNDSNAAPTSSCYNDTTITDTTPPTITFVSRMPAANANGWNNGNVTVTWSCSDSGSGVVSATISQIISTEGSNQSATGTCQDLAGNSASNTQTGINIDKTNPILNLPSNITVEATSLAGAMVSYSVSASDNLDAAPSFNCSPISGSTFVIGTTMVNCTATDQAGNTAFGNFNVTVQDTAAPVIAAHADITAEATSASGAIVTYTNPATSDAVDGAGAATCLPASGGTFPLGNTTVTCNATDSHGNTASPTTFVVHVVDTVAPVIASHADVTVEATSASGATASYVSPSTSDVVDGSGTATCAPASGSTFPLGNTTVTCNATDSHGNAATPTAFVVHVVDTTGPVIAAHADVFVAATSPAGATATYTSPTTSDAVDGPGTATCTPSSGTLFPIGNTTVTCNATDQHGNTATPTTFVVHVVDTAAPVIDGHLDVTVEATSAAGAIANYTSPATSDAVDGPGVATCSPASGTFFNFGNTTVTCNATDSNGNEATPTTFVVHVVDTTAPVIAAHASISVTTNNTLGTIVTYASSATSDAVDGVGIATCSPASGGFFPVGNTIVTCNETDAHGNAAQPATFIVHVAYQAGTPTSTPPTNGNESGLSIPITGGLFDLDCLTVIDILRIKVTFHNLCDYQAAVTGTQLDTLPAPLPHDFSFVQGLNVLVLLEQQVVKELPTGTGVQVDFPIAANTQDEYVVLLWNDEDGDGNGEWLDVMQLVVDQDLSKVMSTNPDDELYEIRPTKVLEAFYRIITTEKTGTFVLVKK